MTATVVDVVCCFPKGESRTTSAGDGAVSTTPDPHFNNHVWTVQTKIVGQYGFFFSG